MAVRYRFTHLAIWFKLLPILAISRDLSCSKFRSLALHTLTLPMASLINVDRLTPAIFALVSHSNLSSSVNLIVTTFVRFTSLFAIFPTHFNIPNLRAKISFPSPPRVGFGGGGSPPTSRRASICVTSSIASYAAYAGFIFTKKGV